MYHFPLGAQSSLQKGQQHCFHLVLSYSPLFHAAFPLQGYVPQQDPSAQGVASWSSLSRNAAPVFKLPCSFNPATLPILKNDSWIFFFSPEQIKVCIFKILNTNKLSWLKHHLGSSQISINLFSHRENLKFSLEPLPTQKPHQQFDL